MTDIRLSAVIAFKLCISSFMVSTASQAMAVPQEELVISSPSGSWAGTVEESIAVFKGIQFAQPPLGALRWEAPVALSPSPQVSSAKSFALACMQTPRIADWYREMAEAFGGSSDGLENPVFSEDCLYLNVWAPAKLTDKKLPVYVWIHGGSNKSGWAYEPNYHGQQLAKQGIVVVSIAYRMGAFGYISHPDLANQTAAANFGLLDQVAALQWIQKNIGAFGGDANRVTIGGESSGAANVSYLIASPLAEGFFHQAIHQSGGFQFSRPQSLQQHAELGTLLGDDLAANTIDQLRQISATAILDSANKVLDDHFFSAADDGYSLIDTPLSQLNSGEFSPVNLLIGTNGDEDLAYLDQNTSETDVILETAKLFPGSTERAAAAIADGSSPLEQLDTITTAHGMLCPSLYLANRMAATGKQVWAYQFNQIRSGDEGQRLGAYHGVELPYVFDRHDSWLPTSDNDKRLTEQVVAYWANFIKTGSPNTEGLFLWPQYQAEQQQVIRLQTKLWSGAIPNRALCDILWAEYRSNNSH
ncbi:MAG: carboxylesterase family protein [Pseudomonadales bacterium]